MVIGVGNLGPMHIRRTNNASAPLGNRRRAPTPKRTKTGQQDSHGGSRLNRKIHVRESGRKLCPEAANYAAQSLLRRTMCNLNGVCVDEIRAGVVAREEMHIGMIQSRQMRVDFGGAPTNLFPSRR